MTSVPNSIPDQTMLSPNASPETMLGIVPPLPPQKATAPETALSTAITTTTAGSDLLESITVIAAGAVIALGIAGTWGWAAAAALISVTAFTWARVKRIRRANENEDELRAKRYVFSSEQLTTAARSELPPEVAGALKLIPPNEALSRWELSYLLASHMGEGRAGEVLPLVLRFARKFA